MDYTQLRDELLQFPGTSPGWLVYTLSYPEDGRPVPTSYCLIARPDRTFLVYQGDGRGGTAPAGNGDGRPIVFPSEDAACRWIRDEIHWWRDHDAAGRDDSEA